MKFETLAQELNKTAAVFRTELSPLALEGYWEAFENDADDDFVTACRKARQECEFMPTIKQVRQYMPDRRGRAAMEATDRWLAQSAAYRPKSWPRLGEPTPVAELVAPYLGPSGEKH